MPAYSRGLTVIVCRLSMRSRVDRKRCSEGILPLPRLNVQIGLEAGSFEVDPIGWTGIGVT